MVSAATGVMDSLLTKLTTLLGEEYKLQKNVKRDVAFLKDELSSMNALLETLADTEVLNPQQKEWRNQVREMTYDIEDCFDDYMHQLHQDSDKSNGIMGFFSNIIEKVKKLGPCHQFAEQMRELKTRVVEASQRRDRYKLDAVLDSGSSEVVPIDPRLPALYAEASSLVGTDVPRDELIKLVDDGEKSLKVVSIVGFGGLGKTTLANQVYQKVGGQFDCRAFVSVSQKPDTRKILQSILSQVRKHDVKKKKNRKQEYERTESGNEECLINALRDFLKDKRYEDHFDGVLLAHEVTVEGEKAKILNGLVPYFGVPVHANLLLFSPQPDMILEGKVEMLGKESIHAIVLGVFSAAIMSDDIREKFKFKRDELIHNMVVDNENFFFNLCH